MKKILILVAGISNIPIIKAAKQLGHYVITCDNSPNNPGHQFADEKLFVDVYDYRAIIQRIKHKHIDKVWSFVSSHGLVSAAKIAEHYGLEGYSYQNLEILRNKHLFREFLGKHQLDCPKFISTPAVKDEQLKGFRFPVILKPVDAGGGRGVHKVNSLAEVKAAFLSSKRASSTGRVIIEEFIQSSKVINGDCLVKNRQIRASVIGDYYYDKQVSEVLPTATAFPTGFDDSPMLTQLEILIEKLQIPDGVINFEAILTADKSFLIEINPRPSGNYLWQLMGFKFGVDIPEILVRLYNNHPLPEWNSNNKQYAYQLIYSSENGFFAGYEIPEKVRPFVRKKILFKEMGDPVKKLSTLADRVGILLLEFDEKKERNDILTHPSLFKIES